MNIIDQNLQLIHGEKICFEAIAYGLLGVATWAAACVFFVDAATLWTVSFSQQI